ncbi:MAG: MarR family transcriptional regulator [Xanthomonadales bacterium]|nr:MarR family transcriptional regulator [Xanthomonadales bacterium]
MSENNKTTGQAFAHFDLEHFLPYRLSVVSNTVSQGIAHIYQQDHDLTVIEWRIIAVLGRYPGLTASQVVERTVMDKVSVSRAVKRLLERGLLQRRTHGSDRRCRTLELTNSSGRKTFESIVPRARKYEQALLADFDALEIQTLVSLLSRLQNSAVRLDSAIEPENTALES